MSCITRPVAVRHGCAYLATCDLITDRDLDMLVTVSLYHLDEMGVLVNCVFGVSYMYMSTE